MAKDINKDKFTEETTLKLEIFAECFREWFPVFICNKFIEKVYIYDFLPVMEKFLKVCWTKDKLSGESNCNIDNDFQKDSLFYTVETRKKQEIELKIRNQILSKEISDNISGLKFALKNGCLPELFTSVVKKLEKEKKIERTGGAKLFFYQYT